VNRVRENAQLSDIASIGMPASSSPLQTFRQGLRDGVLLYQRNERGDAIFYPRLVCPFTGSSKLEWKASGGVGTVYSTTVVTPRNGDAYNVSLVDLDEGFRLMSRVEGLDAKDVAIGMRVCVAFRSGETPDDAYHVFIPCAEGER